MNYKEALDFLFTSLPMYQRVGPVAFKKDLTNIKLLCEHLDHPEKKFKSIHIAGTNGKGSSAHMIASVLKEAGYKTGLYTSPHLKRFTERIRIGDIEIPENDVTSFINSNFERIKEINPSFFEITVAMAFWYFAKMEVDIAVVEVGLGGRLDSTNVITPLVALITNISLDHTEMLGTTLKDIAAEKGGIIKENIPVVIGEYDKDYVEVFEKIASSKNAPVYFAEKCFTVEQGGIIDLRTGAILAPEIVNWPGYQFRNVPGVIMVLDILKQNDFRITNDHIIKGIENFEINTGLKGRWQIINNIPLTICDTAHNIAGFQLILEDIRSLKFEKLHMVLGMVKDKDAFNFLKLMPRNAFYYFCRPDIPRGMDAHLIFEAAQKLALKGEVFETVNSAITTAKSRAGNKDVVFIGGSSFVVAEVENL